jgi:hypothetical protein
MMRTWTAALAATFALLISLNAGAHSFFFHTIKLSQANPSALSLSHTSNNKTFTVSWTGGAGNGNCKVQFQNSPGVYTDVTSPTVMNCDAAVSNTTITLPSVSPWSASGQSRSVRIIRFSDSAIVGTFGQNLNCSSLAGAASSTPNVDEDCNGNWDNAATGPGTLTCSATFTGGQTCTKPGASIGDTASSAAHCKSICEGYGNYASGNSCCVYGTNVDGWGSNCALFADGAATGGSFQASPCTFSASTLYY